MKMKIWRYDFQILCCEQLCCFLLFVANIITNILKEIKSELIQGEDRFIPKMQVVSSWALGKRWY